MEATAYTIPTDAPESDGTFAWDSTTMVLVTARAGGKTGTGYTYAGTPVVTVVQSQLADEVTGRDALQPPARGVEMQHAVRNLGKPGVAAEAISAVDIALWDLRARLLDEPLVVALGAFHDATPIYGGFARSGQRGWCLAWLPTMLVGVPEVGVCDDAGFRGRGVGGPPARRDESDVGRVSGLAPGRCVGAKGADEFLLARAMEHDSPTLLFRLACEYLISARVIRPGPDTVVRRVAHARAEAQQETYDRLAHEFTPERCAELDALLAVDSSIGMSRLGWLSTGPVTRRSAMSRSAA